MDLIISEKLCCFAVKKLTPSFIIFSIYEGYNGMTCSPLVLGKIPDKIRDAVKCAYDALNFASAKMKPDTPCDIVLGAYESYSKKFGYIEYCPYGSLHSTGMLECEAPMFSSKK